MNRRKIANNLLVALATALAAPHVGVAQQLSHVFPVGITRGGEANVTAFGGGLATAQALWTSIPTTASLTGAPTDNQATFRWSTPADAPLGIAGVRVATAAGISELRLFVVDDLPIVVKQGNNQTQATAQKITLPTAVDGIMGGEQSDFYAFEVQAGQRVAFEAIAHRLGVDFDPLLRLFSPDGKEILSHDNDEGLGYDCLFEHAFPAAGTYVLEIRDTRYMGGGNWAYHLRIGDFPIARVTFPAGGVRGRWATVAFPGRAATDVAPVAIQLPSDPLVDRLQLVAKNAGASAWAPFVIEDSEQQLELEPNDDVAQANAFTLGRILDGRFQAEGDVDAYRFAAKKGQIVRFEVETRHLSSPADAYLRVLNEKGEQVATADDVGLEDAILDFNVPADGAYIVTLEDLNRRGGPNFIYRLRTEVGRVDYALQSAVDRIVAPRGSKVPFNVNATRAGYNGAIELSAHATSPALALTPTTIGEGAGSAVTLIAAAVDAPLGLQTLRISGTGKVGDATLVRAADQSALTVAPLNNLQLAPPGVARDIAILVIDRPHFQLAATLNAKNVARFTKTAVTVTAAREKFFDDEIAVQIENLPPEVAVAPKPIPKGQIAVQLEFDSKPKTPVGRFSTFVSGTVTRNGVPERVFADVLTFDLSPAYSLSIEPAEIKLARGGKVGVTIQAERHPGYNGPIAVDVKNLPAGVSASKGTIPENQTTVALELTAAGDAKPITDDKLHVVGSATINGQAEAANSPQRKIIVTEN